MMELYSSIPIFVIVTLASTYVVAMAYKNTKFVLKHKVIIPELTMGQGDGIL